MGTAQSTNSSNDFQNQHHNITIVNPTPEIETNREDEVNLPKRVPPILSIDRHIIDPKLHKPEHQLDYQLWVDFISTIDKYLTSRAELVATRQSQVQEKIISVDDHVQRFTDSYVIDKHKALARMNDDCRKVDEISKTLQKCTLQSEICVDMLNKLNFLLPAEHKLEPLELCDNVQKNGLRND